MTIQRRAPSQAGFSLVEIMVVLIIFMIVAGAVFAAINAAQVRYRAEKQFLDSFQGARIGIDLMVRDIHNAGYPRPHLYAGNFPKLPAGPTPVLVPDPVPWDAPTDAAPALQERFKTDTSEAWFVKLDAVGIPAGPVMYHDEVFHDPHVLAREMVVEVDHTTAGRQRTLGTPVKLSDTKGSIRRAAPLLGEHTDEVLAELEAQDKAAE